MRNRAFYSLGAASMLLVACSSEAPPTNDQLASDDSSGEVEVVGTRIEPRPVPANCGYDHLPDALEVARAQWSGAGIDDYGYSVTRHAMWHLVGWPSSKPLTISVRDGVAASDLPKLDQETLQSLTVEGQFSHIGEMVVEGPDCLKVAFDQTFGFPSSIYVDPEWGVVDDEIELVFSNFAS